MMKKSENPQLVHITYKLTGESAELFLRIKEARFLENNTELARSLMLERLHEIARETITQAPPSSRDLAA